jgi:carboxypeptidase C (cathepsin A)
MSLLRLPRLLLRATAHGLAALALAASLSSALAQAPAAEPARREQAQAKRLPADSVTEHTLALPDRTLRFSATAGALPISDGDTVQAEIAYVAFLRGDTPQRPVTFVLNGGPGASSAYLNLGAMGPWRLPLDHASPSVPLLLLPNAETWLDFTDLVFIDPVGAGYSRLIVTSDAVRKQFWSIDGDVEALAVFMRKWLEKNGRQASAKFLVGESYGGFRAPKIARALRERVGFSALVLVSPVLDFGWRGQGRHAPLSHVARLPSMTATALELKGPFDREALREVERYAAGDYLLDLMRGERDQAAVERISARVAAFTGLDPALVLRLAGRVDTTTFQRELSRQRGRVGSIYDATFTGLDPYPTSASSHFSDPFMSAVAAPLTNGMTELYQRVLQWRVEEPFQLLNREISGRWDWGRGRTSPEAVDDLRNVLAADQRLRVLISHGASDLVTPYFEQQLLIEQLPDYGNRERLTLSVYGGGHMFYSRDASRAAFRADAERLYRAVLAPKDLGTPE